MKLYYFPSPNPQKVKFALLELGLECELVPVDLIEREQREAWFLALNPCGRVPAHGRKCDAVGITRDPELPRR
jgi:glutathione S-transferase